MPRYALAAAAAFVALAAWAPAAARDRPAAASAPAAILAACAVPATATDPELPQFSAGDLEDKIDQLTDTIADLTDRLASLEDAIDPDGDDGLDPDEDLDLARLNAAHRHGLGHHAWHSRRTELPLNPAPAVTRRARPARNIAGVRGQHGDLAWAARGGCGLVALGRVEAGRRGGLNRSARGGDLPG